VTELLAPAGNWDCARAAVANGADAIYFGLPKFNARMRADNFTEEDLPELMDFLHRHGVKGFVAFNTLVFPSELEGAVDQIETMARSGVDAVIVQDLGAAKLVQEIAPEMELHASTQMTITSPEGLAFVDGFLDLDRAVLAREMSVEEITRVRKKGEVPLEVFVHGALCVAYSGQCLTSESLGQRSANRGECAQACRMPYELVVDGETVPMGEVRYLLSPQDLAAVDVIPDLVKAGVTSYKIEGRLKVARVCRCGDAGLSQGVGRRRDHREGSLHLGDDVFAGAFERMAGGNKSSPVDSREVGKEARGVGWRGLWLVERGGLSWRRIRFHLTRGTALSLMRERIEMTSRVGWSGRLRARNCSLIDGRESTGSGCTRGRACGRRAIRVWRKK
jgi:collagenase-like PrtC family protease